MNKGAPIQHFTYIHFFIKKWNRNLCLFAIIMLSGISMAYSQSTYLLRATLGNAVATTTLISNKQITNTQQCIGQGSAIGTFYKNGYILRQGFIQPSKARSASVNTNKIPATIYPNPASEKTTIHFTEPISGPVNVALFDLCGKKLYTQIFPVSNEINLNYQPLSAGIYILEVRAGDRYFSTKLIKE